MKKLYVTFYYKKQETEGFQSLTIGSKDYDKTEKHILELTSFIKFMYNYDDVCFFCIIEFE